MSGAGVLRVAHSNEPPREYTYPNEDPVEVEVAINEIMQWRATDDDLTFYEICEPPYQPGRYVDLPDEAA